MQDERGILDAISLQEKIQCRLQIKQQKRRRQFTTKPVFMCQFGGVGLTAFYVHHAKRYTSSMMCARKREKTQN